MIRLVFMDFIILADRDGKVDMTQEAFAARTNVPVETIYEAAKQLEKPDPRSRSRVNNGARIKRLSQDRDWGWEIVNYEFYRNKGSKADKREADRLRMERKRLAQKNSAGVAKSRKVSRAVADVAHTDTDTDIKKQTDSAESDFLCPKGNNHWSQKVGKWFQGIETAGKKIEVLEKSRDHKTFRFNPWQYIQKALKEGIHPGLISEILDMISIYWNNIETNPWKYTARFKKTKQQNWNEREAIEIHEHFKSMDSGQLTNLTRGLLKSF